MNALYDICRVFTATTGTGAITLGSAVTGYLTFAQAGVPDGAVVSYGIADTGQSETGAGTYNAGAGTLTRSVYRSTGAGNNTPISLSGNAQVFITALSADFAGLAALASPVFTGDPKAPTPAPTDNDTSIATTAFVQSVTSNYLPLTGGRLSGGLASGPAATAIPGAGALTLNANTVAPLAGQIGNLMVLPADATNGVMLLDSYGAANNPFFIARRTRGTSAAPTAVQSGDTLLNIIGQGYAASTFGVFGGCAITFGAAENWTASANGSGLTLRTTPIGTAASVASLILQGNTATFSGSISLANGANISWGGGAFPVINSDGTSMFMRVGSGGFLFYNGANTNIIAMSNNGDFQIAGSNATKASGTTWANPSARDLKENIQPYQAGLQAVLALQPRTWDFAADSGIEAAGPHIGLIHDETAHMPEMHRTLTLGGGPDEPGREVDGLDCSAITFALVNAIRELTARIEALEGKAAP